MIRGSIDKLASRACPCSDCVSLILSLRPCSVTALAGRKLPPTCGAPPAASPQFICPARPPGSYSSSLHARSFPCVGLLHATIFCGHAHESLLAVHPSSPPQLSLCFSAASYTASRRCSPSHRRFRLSPFAFVDAPWLDSAQFASCSSLRRVRSVPLFLRMLS
jgi:hypothetical protein